MWVRDGETTTPYCRSIVERREETQLDMCLRGTGVVGKWREVLRMTVFCLKLQEAGWAVGTLWSRRFQG